MNLIKIVRVNLTSESLDLPHVELATEQVVAVEFFLILDHPWLVYYKINTSVFDYVGAIILEKKH